MLTGCAHFVNKSETRRETTTTAPDGTVTHEVLTDSSRGSGTAFLTDPRATGIQSTHTNQAQLGGGRSFQMGLFESYVSTNGITATGTASGKVLGAAAASFIGIP